MREEIMSREWFWAVVITWAAVMILNELAYAVWKQMNPGHMFSLNFKIPLTPWQSQGLTNQPVNDFPNGYRPVGGG